MGFGGPKIPAATTPAPPPQQSPFSAMALGGSSQQRAAAAAAGRGMNGTVLTDPEGILASSVSTGKTKLGQ